LPTAGNYRQLGSAYDPRVPPFGSFTLGIMGDGGTEVGAALTISSAKLTGAQMMQKAGLEPGRLVDRGDPLSPQP
jgi:hypothetical protein